MCVCNPWNHRDPVGLFLKVFQVAGGQPREHSWLPNEEGYSMTDMESDPLHVPALFELLTTL